MALHTISASADIATDLRGTIGTDGAIMQVLGTASVLDGNGGTYVYNTTSSVADNGTTVIKPTPIAGGSPGRWLLVASLQQSLSVSSVKSANFTATTNTIHPADTTSNSVIATLPNAPADKSKVVIKTILQGTGNNVSIVCSGIDVFNKVGGGTSISLLLLNQSVTLQYDATTKIWYVLSDDMTLSGLDARYLVQGNNNYTTQIYNKFEWANLNDFTVVGSITPTIITSAGTINYVGTPGNFTNYLLLNNRFSTDENWTFEMIFRQNLPGAASGTQGICVGIKSTNTVSGARFSLAAQYSTSSAPLSQFYNPETATAIGSPVSSTGSVNAATDILKLTMTRQGATIISTIQNKTKGVGPFTNTIYNTQAIVQPWVLPNTGQFAIYFLGGNIDIMSVNVFTKTIKLPIVAFFGDSKTGGAYANSDELRFPNLIASQLNIPVAVFAGGGDETKDTLLAIDSELAFCKPKYGVINIGRNDAQRGISSAVYQANYTSIRNKIVANGSIPIHLLPIPETAFNQASLKSWIQGAFPSDLMIDVSAGWVDAYMLSTDNVHPNPQGMRYIASQIIATGYIV